MRLVVRNDLLQIGRVEHTALRRGTTDVDREGNKTGDVYNKEVSFSCAAARKANA